MSSSLPCLSVMSLRYSSWSMRPWLALCHAGARFTTETIEVKIPEVDPNLSEAQSLSRLKEERPKRRKKASVTGLFPVLRVGDTRIHESLAICEWVNEVYPQAKLWPDAELARAKARAISCEILSSFHALRSLFQCHLFGRLDAPMMLDTAVSYEVERIFEIWSSALDGSGGPFLFGSFSIADCMYYPVRTRFQTYRVPIPSSLASYVSALDSAPCVTELMKAARSAPRIKNYDDYLLSLGGDPDGSL